MRLALILFALAAFGQTPIPPAPKPEPPKITAEMRARFWRLEAESISLQWKAEKATAAAQAAQQEMVTACGGPIVSGPDGEPTCAPKSPLKDK